jgi:hypothetical protein
LRRNPPSPAYVALGVLADDDEIEILRLVDEGTQVDEQIEIETHLQQEATLDDPRGDTGPADRTVIQRVEAAPLVDDLVGQDRAVAQVAGCAEVVVSGVEIDARGADHLEALGDDLGPMPSPAMMPTLCATVILFSKLVW